MTYTAGIRINLLSGDKPIELVIAQSDHTVISTQSLSRSDAKDVSQALYNNAPAYQDMSEELRNGLADDLVTALRYLKAMEN